MKQASMVLFNDLLQKYIREELSPAELTSFLALAREPANQDVLRDAVGHLLDAETYADLTEGVDIDLQFVGSMKKAQSEGVASAPRSVGRTRVLYWQWWAAASVLLILITGGWFWFRNSRQQASVSQRQRIDIGPGKQGAVLTLADGTPMVLDSLGDGIIATQNGASVTLNNGQLAYRPATSDKLQTAGEVAFNTLSTPRGRQFFVTLPDGTKAWLNTASSLQYPTVFSGKERLVQVTGEVYFEVAENMKMPFRVRIGEQSEIEVLGTHFNVNAYRDEAEIRTTLLEGKVKVLRGADSRGGKILQPGQQALVRPDDLLNAAIAVQAADVDKVMAWKNGVFNFEGASIREVMRQIERWYDITVIYEKGVPDIKFFGEISRNVTLTDLVDALKDVGVHFKIETGRRLVVLP